MKKKYTFNDLLRHYSDNIPIHKALSTVKHDPERLYNSLSDVLLYSFDWETVPIEGKKGEEAVRFWASERIELKELERLQPNRDGGCMD